jgi:type II secretory pathway pseudopilin PulG
MNDDRTIPALCLVAAVIALAAAAVAFSVTPAVTFADDGLRSEATQRQLLQLAERGYELEAARYEAGHASLTSVLRWIERVAEHQAKLPEGGSLPPAAELADGIAESTEARMEAGLTGAGDVWNARYLQMKLNAESD